MPPLPPSWKNSLSLFLKSEAYKKLSSYIQQEYLNKTIYPKEEDLFKSFALTPLTAVKVVILGQDPYHGEGQAHGLCFSVGSGKPLPPSLKNIYKEIENDCSIKKDFTCGNLESLATQGVFLLNSILTVEADSPASHKGAGWEVFTDTVIKTISDNQEHVVFMLWGNFAKSKKVLIDTNKHLILEAPHPSPFSAYTGFFGCKHFSKCNEYLRTHNKKEIAW